MRVRSLGKPGNPPFPIDSSSEAVPSLGPQLLVCHGIRLHPSSPLLGRRLVAGHHLLGHLSFQRACFRLSEGVRSLGAQRLCSLEPGRFVLEGKGSLKKREAGVWDTAQLQCVSVFLIGLP